MNLYPFQVWGPDGIDKEYSSEAKAKDGLEELREDLLDEGDYSEETLEDICYIINANKVDIED